MRGRHILFLSLLVIAVVAIAGIPPKSQYYEIKSNGDPELLAGRNVNMVSGTVLPDGDPWLQRQNEPSIAVSTRNPLHLLAGANDYRTVDMPFSEGELPGAGNVIASGDAWLGVFKSLDGGESWKSTLLDGYPQQNNLNSPLNGYQAAADPVVRAGTNGMFFYSGIVFNRLAPKNSAVFVARFIDNNNDEEGDPILHIDTTIIDSLNGGRFKDKPWIAVDIPKKNAKTVTIAGQSIPKSNVYIVYSVFEGEGENLESKIMFSRSTDTGNSWEEPIEISQDHHLNQGATIAVDPRGNGHVFVAWRRFASGEGQTAQTNAIVIARSTNGGKEFPDVIEVTDVPGPFDQPTSSTGGPLSGTAFRTNSYPSMAIDKKGRIYLVWAQREVDLFYPNDSRVLIATSKDGFIWTTPMTVESSILSANGPDCYEFMPSIAFAGGRLILAWYDTRKDYCPEISPPWICDPFLPGTIRHTIDVRVAQGQPGEFPVFQPSVQVSRYLWAMWEGSPGNYYFSQVQFNPPNYPLFMGGTVPFHSDYIDISPSPPLVQSSKGVWRFNTEPSDSQQFHVAWTDNRDVRPPENNNWEIYNPPTSSQSFSQSQFLMTTPCNDPQNTGMRNQNIYTSCITSVMEAGAPGNNKPLGTLGTNPATGEMIPRAFVIFIKNPTEDIRSYRMQITDGPAHGTASFLEFDILMEIDVSIAPYSTVSRPLFVTSSDENDTVTVEVFEIDQPGGSPVAGGAQSTIVINPDETNPEVTGDLATSETHDPDIASPNIVNWTYVNPNIVNPHIVNPNIVNPNIVNPNIVNPNIVNPNIVNPNIVNPNIVNPNIVNPNIVNPNIVNPNIVNSSIEDADVTDIEWTVTNAGNTISSYTFKIFARESLPRGIYAQLLVYKVHLTPATDGFECELKQTPHHELLMNIINPNIVNPNIVNPNIVNPNIVNAAIENATFFLSPGDEAKVVLRLIDPDPGVTKFLQSGKRFKIQSFAESLGAATGSQAVDSDDALQGDTTGEADSTELIITTGGLPDGIVGEDYLTPEFQIVRLEAAGGDGIYLWSVNSEQLPPGLGFENTHEGFPDNKGIIQGIPQDDMNVTYPHVYSFLVQVSSGGDIDTQNLSITINSAEEPTPPLNIETITLPPGTVGNYYGYTLQATGGIPPRSWGIASGSLPAGLTLDSSGVISGTINNDPDVSSYPYNYEFVVQVTDANEDTDTQSLSIMVSDIVYPDLTISGTITDGYGSSVQGVSIYGLPHAPQTDGYGFYSDTVPHGWSGTITPFKAGYNFQVSTQDPSPNRNYTEITTNQYSQDFVADTINYIISGTVTFYGSPLAGVTMNGLPGTPITNAEGYYSAPVPHGWSGTVSPELLAYIFEPPNRAYASITSDHVLQDYAAFFTGVGQDDPFEDNDDFNNASRITPGTIMNLQLYDDDWYRVNVGEGEDLGVTINGDIGNDIDVEIRDSSGNRITGAYGSPQDETAYASDLSSGWYYIYVVFLGDSGFWNSYSLTVETGDITAYGDITGKVTNTSTNGIQGVEIWSFDTQSEHYFITTTESNGDYQISLPPSVYKLKFETSNVTPENYVSEYYDSKYTYDDADEVLLQAGDLIGGVDAQLEEGSVLAITTTSLPNGNVAISYSVNLEALGGTTPYNWNLAPGSGPLPNGLNLHETGLIDGIPTTTGTFDFTIQVTDSSTPTPQADEKAYSVTIGSADNYPEGMISYWKFDEGDGSSAYDSFDINHGTIIGAAWTPGQVNDALSFDGEDDYVSVGDFAGYSDNVSVEAWIRTPGSGGVDNWDDIVCGPVGDIIFGISGNRLNFAGQGATPIDHNTWSTTLLDDNEWHHVAGTYDGSEVCVYVDGQKEAFNPASGSFAPGFKRIGRGDYDGEHFNGLIDEVAIYNRALSPLEVEQHYLNGLNGMGYEVPAGDLVITTTSLPDGDLAMGYNAQLEAAGGTEPYSWSLASGSGPLPGGLTLNNNGIIDGSPTTLGTFHFTVEVTDGSSPLSQTATQPLSITISAYAGTDYAISGTVTPPLLGVVMSGFPGNPITNSSGEYTAYVYSGWSGTVTPILTGYAFDPASRTYNNVSDNIPGENYTASTGYVISGQVSLDGSPLGGVSMSGLPGDPLTDENGQYSGAVPSGWSGTVTPTLPGFTFTPTNISYSNVTANQPNRDYTANYAGGQDDAYENNDDFASAAEVPLGTHTNLVLLDEDWFKVYVSAAEVGKDLKVHIKGTSYPNPNERHDLDFGIFDHSEKILGGVLSRSDDETLYITDITEGWYYIGQTYIYYGAVYSMTLEVSDNFGIGYISGRLTDEQSGQGIEGAYVELYGDPFDWDISRPMITTDANGEYKVGYAPGNYTVRFNLQAYEAPPNYMGETYNWNEVFSVVAGTTIEGIDAQLEPGGAVTGRVTDPDGNGLNNGIVYVYSSDTTRVTVARTNANGYYSAERMRTGNYKVRARVGGYVSGSMWYDEMGSFEDGHPVPVQVGTTTSNIHLQLEESASIEGRVTDSNDDPILDVVVRAYDVSGISLWSSHTDDNGEYRIDYSLPVGDVKIYFDASNAQGNYASEYYTDKLLIEEADPVSVQAGETTYGIDAVLADGGTISGRVTDAQDDGFAGVAVQCFDIDSDRVYGATTDADGYYTITGLLPDDYKVRFRTTYDEYATQWYNGGFSFAAGTVVSVGAGANVTNIKAQLTNNGGFISGRVTNSSGNGLEDVRVFAQDNTKEAGIAWADTDADGYYTIPRIPTCSAKVYFNTDLRYLNYASEYYNDKSTHANADTVAVTFGQETTGINAVLAQIPPANITTTSLPNGEVAAPYDETLEVTGGREFYHWSLISGTLPQGLSFNSKGEITGTPTAIGTHNFTVRVTDSSRNQLIDTQSLSITIDAYSGAGYLISGAVTSEGSPLGGVVLQGLPGDPMTSPSGDYIVAVPQGWSGTVIPSLFGYTFDPPSRSYADVNSNLENQDYAASEAHMISGVITFNGSNLQGVVMNGLPGDPVTNAAGYYSASVPHEWSGTVTPGLSGYTFDPPSRTYDPVISDQVNQDYIASSTGGIEDDSYEPNDDFGSAVEITAGTYPNLQLFNDDWFKIYVEDNMDLKLTLSGVSENNIDFGMCDSSGKYLVGGLSSSSQDTIYYHTASSGYYYIRIPYTWGGDLQNTYTLTAEISDNLGLGQVFGRVTGSTNNPLHVRVRVFDQSGYRRWNTLTDPATGEYRISLPPGNFKIRFITSPILDYYGGINYLSRFYGGHYFFEEAPLLEVLAGATISDIDGQLVEGGTITGTVTDLQGNTIEGAFIRVRDLDGDSVTSAYSNGSGQYAIERLFTNYYKVFVRSWTQNHGIEWYNDKPSFDESDAVYVETGQNTSGIDFQLTEGGNVEGRVTDVNGGVEGVQVVAYDPSKTIPFLYPSAQIPQIGLLSTWTDNNGDYFMGHLPIGDVSLYFNTNNTHHVPEWYDDELDFEDSIAVPIQAGQTTMGIDAELAEAGSIAGRVTDSSGNGLKDVLVWIFNLNDTAYYQAYVYTDDEGYYQRDHIPAGNVKVRFRPNIYTSPAGNWAVEWYNDKNSYAAANQVTVAANQTTSGIDAVLADNAGTIQGRVIDGGGQGIGGVQVTAYDGSIQAQVSQSYTDADGYYSVPRIPTCNVKLAFFTDNNKLPYASEFYNNQSSYEDATPVSVVLGQTTTLPDVVLSNRPNLAVTTATLPNGDVGTPYSQALAAMGGTLQYHWSLAPGSNPLPNGLYLKSTGVIEGIPTAEGTFLFTAQVVDCSYPPQEALSQILSITINTYAGSGVIISGRVTSEGFPLGGVILDGLPGNIQTNASGDYIAVVSSGWSGTATAVLPGYAFTPLNRSYDNVTANQIDQDYATSVALTISGTVWLDGQGLPGVIMSGLPGDPTTDGNGFYMASIPPGWSGTVTPSKEGLSFDPPSRNYVSVASDQMDQDYDATSLTLEWVARYDGPAANSSDNANAVATDSAGNIYVIGSSEGSGTSGDIVTVKYNSAGVQLWEARYNGPENSSDSGNAIAVDSAGNVYVTGYGGIGQSVDYVTIKYDTNGGQVWTARYNGPGDSIDRANAIAVDSSANVYVTGFSYESAGGYRDYATVKYDSNGNQVWAATYDGPANGNDGPVDIAVDASGNVYVTGVSQGSGTGDDYATIKYDSNGNQDWVVRHDSIGGSDRPIALEMDAAANVYVTGRSPRSGTGYDYATIKYDTDGNQVWVAWYDNNTNHDYPQDIALDPSGNVYVTGEVLVTYPNYDYATVKYDGDGVEQWAATYDGPANGSDNATAVTTDSSGNVYVTGESIGNAEFNEYATVKYDSMGGEVWTRRYDGSANGDDRAAAIVVDSSGNIVVTGGSHGSSTANDYGTIKYDSDGNQQWLARYNGPTNEENLNWLYGDVFAKDASDNVYVSGYSYGNGTGYDYTTVKFDSSGNQVWAKQYNGPGNYTDYAYGMTVDSSGNVYVTGVTYLNNDSRDYATVKYDSAGNQQWAASYDGPANGNDVANAIAVDASGNVYVTGQSDGIGTYADCTTIKYDSAGNQTWIARYDGPGDYGNSGDAIALDASGNVYVAGSSDRDILIIKYDSGGNELWVRTYDGPESGSDSAYFIAFDSLDNIYVCGQCGGSNSYDYATVKHDSAGNFQWAAHYDGAGHSADYPLCLAVDSADNVYVTGWTSGSDISRDFTTIKYDAATGNELWARKYEGESTGSSDYGSDIAFDSSGNVYVSGRSGGSSTYYDSACVTIKYDSAGNQLWIAKYKGPGNGFAAGYFISVNAIGEVYIGGIGDGIGTGFDFIVLKYRQ